MHLKALLIHLRCFYLEKQTHSFSKIYIDHSEHVKCLTCVSKTCLLIRFKLEYAGYTSFPHLQASQTENWLKAGVAYFDLYDQAIDSTRIDERNYNYSINYPDVLKFEVRTVPINMPTNPQLWVKKHTNKKTTLTLSTWS